MNSLFPFFSHAGTLKPLGTSLDKPPSHSSTTEWPSSLLALTTASGFIGRHEYSHHEQLMETKRNLSDFMENLRGGDVTPDEETEFLKTTDE
jgi:hypothetical protein